MFSALFHLCVHLTLPQGYVCSVDGSSPQRASGETVLHFPRLEVFGASGSGLDRPRHDAYDVGRGGHANYDKDGR